VANVETYSVLLLRWVNLHPSDVPVWRSAWPLLIVALIATLAVLRATAGEAGTGVGSTTQEDTRRRGPRSLWLWVGAAWGLSVVAPGVLYVLNLREPPHAATWETIRRFLGEFWRHSGGAVVSSAGVSVRVWALACAAGIGVWYAASLGRGWRRTAVLCAGALLAAGILPGVLVGTAIRRGGDMVAPSLGNSTWMVVWAHLSRFGFVTALMGLWLARTEAREERGLRLIDGSTTPRGFAHACLARHWPAVVGAGLAAAILSFHEIEATVMVWPPGSRNLAQEMLDALHYAKDERLAAAAVNLMGAGTVLAYLAGWLAMGRWPASRNIEPPGS
jgi:ABC-type spermidine/putrescine transport system permease subunit II